MRVRENIQKKLKVFFSWCYIDQKRSLLADYDVTSDQGPYCITRISIAIPCTDWETYFKPHIRYEFFGLKYERYYVYPWDHDRYQSLITRPQYLRHITITGCVQQAFKILRKHGHLFLSLFSMMISTGLPELSSEKDLQYLRETLVSITKPF